MATTAAVVLLVSGAGLIGVSIASQHQIPRPPVVDSGYDVPSSGETSGSWLRPGTSLSSGVVGPTLLRSKPIELHIPSIGVRSVVQHLGQAEDGSLETPAPGPHYDQAAWYRYSPTPGSLGPAVILGHVDSAANGPSVFFRLGELRQGDVVEVSRADGSTAVFRVNEVRRYSKDDFPTRLVYNDIDHAGLRILTCGGAFDTTTGHYLDNIVVFASLLNYR